MALNTLLVFLSGLNVAAMAQDASLDTQFAAPVLTSTRIAQTPRANEDRVSVHFHDAKVSEVLSWLENHGVNFVASQDDIPRDKTITINIQNEPIDTVANAIARALGGRWEEENGVRVFRKSAFPQADGSWSAPILNMPSADAKKLQSEWGADFAKKMAEQAKSLHDQFGPDFEKKVQDEAKKWAEQSKDWQKQFGPDFQKKMEEQSKQWAKQFGPDFQKKMEEQSKQWAKQFGPDFQKKMEGQSKQWEKQFGPEFQKKMEEQSKQWEKQFGPEFQKKMEEQSKQLEKQFGPEFQRKMEEQSKQWDRQFGPDFEKRIEAQAKKFENQLGPDFEQKMDSQTRKLQDNAKRLEESAQKRERFFKSLTSDQLDLQSKHGYVWWDELTPEQHEMLGPRPSGKFEMRMKMDGDEIVVRGN